MANYMKYFSNADIVTILDEWKKQYPDILQVSEIGRSYQNQPLLLMTITNRKSGNDLDKPAVWIDANIHATELTGTTVAMNIANELLSGYGSKPEITHIVDHSVYYILPRMNPDGAELAMSSTPKFIRSGVRPYPFDDKVDGLYSKDIDGDGRILKMRIKDPNGDWQISDLDPRLMEKREPDAHGGVYYRLLDEGDIEGYDGFIIQEAPELEGLDFNRNFPFEWRTESVQHGAGPYPASEPEIKCVADFISCHPNINFALTYHTFSRVLLRPYSTKPEQDMDPADLAVYKKIGEIGTKFTGYRCVCTYNDFLYNPKEVTTGAFDDWMYDHYGVFSFTIELWDLPTEAGIENRKFIEWFNDHPREDDLKILQWADENAGDGAYVDWYQYQHPQLGEVELGGWNQLFTWRNPPLTMLEAEVNKNIPFAIACGKMLPSLRIVQLKVTHLSEDNYHIKIAIENSGFLSTYTSNQGKKCTMVRPVRLLLTLPDDGKLINGKKRVDLHHLEGRSNKISKTPFATSPTDNRTRYEWVVNAKKGSKVGISVKSDRAGSLDQEIILE